MVYKLVGILGIHIQLIEPHPPASNTNIIMLLSFTAAAAAVLFTAVTAQTCMNSNNQPCISKGDPGVPSYAVNNPSFFADDDTCFTKSGRKVII